MCPVSAKTRVCGILGHPVEHSLSPSIHNAAFAAAGLDLVYVAHDVVPHALPAAIQGAKALGYRGLSITIPHKVAALACVDEADSTARGIGCINTVVNDQGVLCGYNSDGLGALGALEQAGASPQGKRVVLLGSGGAARAIAFTMAAGAPPSRLVVLGVVAEELATLIRELGERVGYPAEGVLLDEARLRAELPEADLLVQATPVGMSPRVDETLIPHELLRRDLVVFDAVYNPRQTRLLREARLAGARVIEGVEMFLGQAVVQFELWTGQQAPRQVMRRVIEERL
jgi:shikimate dehydrogenase